MNPCFTAHVLGKYPALYEVCETCGYLHAANPHWLDEAYTRAIAAADTGLVMRNIANACKLAGTLYWVLGERGAGRYLDAAGGYGMLTRLMRDIGFDFYWSDKYCDNLLAPGFEYCQALGVCRAVTALEVMEHLTDPAAFIEETLAFSGAQVLIFTTELYEGRPPQPDDWWYYAFAAGQHIGFFQRRTFEILGARFDLQFTSANGIHVLSRTAINKRLLSAVTGRWVSRIAPWWIRRRLGSKTMDDHQLMLRKIA
ncbi:MAG: type 11 methyltransferase [Nitrospirae bacterium]|nr:MAG: type 11 methyltransferase [Nitrospirota bacterium]